MSTKREAPAAPVEQLSFLPITCRCGIPPIVEEGLIHNWCLCEELVAFKTTQEWNDWVTAPRPQEAQP